MASDDVRTALARCLQFEQVRRSRHLSSFLNFVVEQTLAGAQDEINESSIAITALGRDDDFDPKIDPVVRVVAGRLRRALEMYALTEGAGDGIRIVLPRGTYVPRFDGVSSAASETNGTPSAGAGRSGPIRRIVLADDHVMLRRGLRVLLDAEPDLDVVGEADDGGGVLKIARSLAPSVVVMDVAMPDMNGIEATRRLSSELPEIGIVALSVHGGQRFVEHMLRAGARGYVLKESAPEELVTAIRAVARGGTYLSPSVARGFVSRFLESSASGDPGPIALSSEHRRLLRLLAEGFSPQELAERLCSTPAAVGATIRELTDSLDMESVEELRTFAVGVLRPR